MLSRLMTRREQLLLFGVACAISVGAMAIYVHERSDASDFRDVVDTENAQPLQPKQVNTLQSPIDQKTVLVSDPLEKSEEPVVVSVTGAINAPGNYTLDPGSRVKDIIDRAGGVLAEANLSDINMAAKLIDATTLQIPYMPQAVYEDNVFVMRRGEFAAALNPPEYTISGWAAIQASRTALTPDSGNAAPGHTGSAVDTSGLIDLNTATSRDLEGLPGIGPKLASQIINYRTSAPFTSVEEVMNVSGIGPKKYDSIKNLVTVFQ